MYKTDPDFLPGVVVDLNAIPCAWNLDNDDLAARSTYIQSPSECIVEFEFKLTL